MDAGLAVQRLFRVEIRRLVFVIIGFLMAVILVSRCFSDPYGKKLYVSLAENNGTNSSMKIVNSGSSLINTSKSTKTVQVVSSDSDALDSEDDGESESEPQIGNDSDEKIVHDNTEPGLVLDSGNVSSRAEASRLGLSPMAQSERVVSESNEKYTASVLSEGVRNLSAADFEGRFRQSQVNDDLYIAEMKKYEANVLKKKPTTVSQMYSLVLKSSVSSDSMKPRWSSARDRDLSLAKREIEKAPIIRNSRELSTLVFRNVSKFTRSYELMERVLKVYVYKEGDKPVFHQPYMRGIYASEGWFMKLMEANKKFVVRDPKKAHLFYLPFSSQSLRHTLIEKESKDKRILEKQLKRYVDLISRRYRFWNRTDGADHFLVACHDWASYLTRKTMKNCIRSLCNANVAKDYKIGKDTGLPVTYIHSAADPLENAGGKPASERSILAFFAGGLHGYLRPILLRHWGENRETDMKILGPMPRDPEGKRAYREYMKTSKYCVCARGYEVHTPRIVESIFYECVPVIVSDNYVPPFFEVLDWEAFSVFVLEKDVPNLRNILLSISDERYESLRNGVKTVQKHFFWHREPVKYDLFHMTLHSVWNNRLLQVKTR